MSEVNGQLTTCERCGVQIFRKCIGEGERDGGYTRWNNFEPYPEGWGLVSVPEGIRPYDYARVCPECHSKWKRVLLSHFIAGTQLENIEEAHDEN